MREYTAPALTDLGDFRDTTRGYGPIPIYDGITFGIFY
ncbi:keywimysin-related RiPP [Nocardiopsis chromatogenes]|nr:lasso RiPP family leader peptide-containing protein [Nocardiopsis chromatogenes]